MHTARQEAGEDFAITPLDVQTLVQRIGFVDAVTLRDQAKWDAWLADTSSSLRNTIDEYKGRELQSELVAVGDWLAARDYLPSFQQKLLRVAGRLHEFAVRGGHRALETKTSTLLSGIAQVNELLIGARRSSTGSIKGVARELKLSEEAVQLRLRMVGLKLQHFRGPEAVLGRLVMLSKAFGPLALELLQLGASLLGETL
jgi:hypothetical protein